MCTPIPEEEAARPTSSPRCSRRKSPSHVSLRARWRGCWLTSPRHWLGRLLFRRRLRRLLRRQFAGQSLYPDALANPTAALVTLILWQAKTDRSPCVELFRERERIDYWPGGAPRRMVPPCLPVQESICEILCAVAGVRRAGDVGWIRLGRDEPLPALRVTVLQDARGQRVRVSFIPHTIRRAAGARRRESPQRAAPQPVAQSETGSSRR